MSRAKETWEDSLGFTMLLSDGWGRNFFLKKEIFAFPLGFSHVSTDNTVVYSSRIKLSVCALRVCLEDAKQMTGAIAGGRKKKNTFESNSSEGASRGSPVLLLRRGGLFLTRFLSLTVLSLTVGRLR